jgi:hypothetical protein
MYKLFYVRGEEEQLIAEVNSLEEIKKELVKSFKEKGINSPYQRYVGIMEDEIMIDYGSYSNFYFIRGKGVLHEYFKES